VLAAAAMPVLSKNERRDTIAGISLYQFTPKYCK
jgi:hypothetical protein